VISAEQINKTTAKTPKERSRYRLKSKEPTNMDSNDSFIIVA
jgi:hypothetical protein